MKAQEPKQNQLAILGARNLCVSRSDGDPTKPVPILFIAKTN
jgi:hypothetical protein